MPYSKVNPSVSAPTKKKRSQKGEKKKKASPHTNTHKRKFVYIFPTPTNTPNRTEHMTTTTEQATNPTAHWQEQTPPQLTFMLNMAHAAGSSSRNDRLGRLVPARTASALAPPTLHALPLFTTLLPLLAALLGPLVVTFSGAAELVLEASPPWPASSADAWETTGLLALGLILKSDGSNLSEKWNGYMPIVKILIFQRPSLAEEHKNEVVRI